MAFKLLLAGIGSLLAVTLYFRKTPGQTKSGFAAPIPYDFDDADVRIISDSNHDYMEFSMDAIGREVKDDRLWQEGTIVITDNGIIIYKAGHPTPILGLTLDSLSGYFYVDRENKPYQMWIHLESHLWYLLKLQFDHVQTRGGFRELMRVLNTISPDPMEIGYQMKNPQYIHFGTVEASEVLSDDFSWMTVEKVQLFLTPLYLVVLDRTGLTQYRLPLHSITEVRLSGIVDEEKIGIIRLTVDGAYQSFALKDYLRWEQAINHAIEVVRGG